ncbi:MAG: PD40 domain-containing protein [Candidatus Kapabacteria bacterium]|nr:PD40 domain-containing protein [Candidatus Kapabacteria bacterium]
MNSIMFSRFGRAKAALVFAFVGISLSSALPASAQQFGQMPPQYQRFEWQIVQSRSFDVYHHQGGAYLGQYAAATLEESFKTVQRVLGLSFTEKLEVIIYNSPNEALQTNARDILVPKGLLNVNDVRRNRMVVAFNGDWYDFKRSLARELVHGVLNTVFHGAAMPPSVGGQFDLPAWFSGGLAEYLSNDGMSAETDMALRDIILSDRFTSLSTLEPMLRVPVGHAFFWYVGEKFGAGRIGELITRTRGLRSVETAFRSTFGLSLEGFSTIWRRDLKEMYSPDVAKYEDIEKIATRITDTEKDGSFMNADPVWSPVSDKAGDKLAYLSAQGGAERNAQWQVMVQFDGKQQKRTERILSTGRDFEWERSLLRIGSSLLSWKADGTQLAAVVSGGGYDGIVLANPSTGAQQRIETSLQNITGVAFAPDGKSIALTASENEAANLYLYDLTAKKLTKLTNDVFTESEPAWSPDGKILYFLSNRLGTLSTNTSSATVAMWEYAVQSSDVYALNIATKRIERITSTPQERKMALSLTQDGKRLLYVSDRNGIYNAIDYNLAAKTFTPRTSLLAGMREFGLTRDGSKMSLAALKKGALNIFTISNAPADRKIKEPEPTELRKQSIERESAAEKALGRATLPAAGNGDGAANNPNDGIIVQQAPDTLRGYGKVDLTFEGQKMVEPKPEVLAQTARQNALEASDYTVPGKYPSAPMEYGLGMLSWFLTPTFDTFFGGWGAQEPQAFISNFALSGQALWTDPLGNHRLFATASVMPLSYWNNDQFISYSYLPELIDYEASLFRYARGAYIIEQREAVPSLLTYWGGAFKAMLPLSQTMRLEGKLAAVVSVRESLQATSTQVNRTDFVLAPELRFVMDNSEMGYFGPTSGARSFVQVEGVPGMAGQSFARIFGDYRQYIPIKNIATVVGRVAAGTNLGGTSQNFLAGGQENVVLGRSIGPDILPFNRAEDVYFAQAVMPMRAFSIADAQGRNFFVANLECRVSILSSESTSGFLNSLLNGLQGVVFVDAGSAWTNTLRLSTPRALFDTFNQYVGLADGDLLVSVGVGLRTYLLGQYPVKVDMAWQNLQGGLMLPRVVVGFGYNF